MARWAPAAAIYEVADLFRANCLTTGTSLLWPDHRAWTVETIDALLEAFIGRLDEGKESFFEKWRKQLADQSSDVHRVAADALAFFYLFPDQITGDTKIRNVRTVLGWKLGDEGDPAAWPRIEAAFRRGVGGTGPFYTRNLPYGIAYFLTFARTVHERRIPTTDEEALVALADETQDAVKSSRAARHVLLHLLFPDRFERIASGEHKRKIVDAFAAGAAGNEDLDEAILAIRHEIEERTDRPGFDFYDEPDLFTAWNSDPKQADEADFAALHGLVERAYPDPAVRQICLNVLADSIKLAHTVSPASWSLNPRRGQGNLRLNVGPTQACVLSENDLYLVLDRDRLSPELQQRVDTEMVGEDRQGAAYRGTPFAYGAHLPANRLDELLPLVVEAHRSYIGRAAHSMPRTRYQEGHRPESVAFLRQQLGRDLPNPVYGRGEPNPTGDPLTDTGRNPDGEGTTAPSLSALATTAHMPEHEIAEIVDLLRDKRQIILEGPPGSGKTFLADLLARHLAGIPLDGETDERVETVQFHQSYGYEDFVQGIRPDTTSGGSLVYTVVPGIFTRLCARAAANPGQEFVLIVDEINRGNVSRIFGELLMLLEYRDKRVRLPNSTADGPDAYLAIPPNLFLIGTMNSTDRSLALIDYALRRRFYFYRLLPMRDGRAPVLETWLARQEIPEADRVRLLRLFLVLNRRVEERLSPEFQVGHSYFMRGDIQTEAVLGRVWRHAVLPLLEEYLHGARDRQQELAEFALERLAADPADSLPDQVIPLPGQTATS